MKYRYYLTIFAFLAYTYQPVAAMAENCTPTPEKCLKRPSEVRSCGLRVPGKPVTLDTVGQTHTITIFADIENDNTEVTLKADRSYNFSIDNVDSWYDCTQIANPYTGWSISTADIGVLAKATLLLFKPVTYSPAAGYMELLGEVAGEQLRLGQLATPVDPDADAQKLFSPGRDGVLITRVNEPRFFNSRFYENNSGSLELTITVVK